MLKPNVFLMRIHRQKKNSHFIQIVFRSKWFTGDTIIMYPLISIHRSMPYMNLKKNDILCFHKWNLDVCFPFSPIKLIYSDNYLCINQFPYIATVTSITTGPTEFYHRPQKSHMRSNCTIETSIIF
jgi:hypothetical protein